MSHNETCILSGPGGGWEVDGYTQDPSGASATSFTYGCNSLYLKEHQNYTDILSWLLFYKNSKFQVHKRKRQNMFAPTHTHTQDKHAHALHLKYIHNAKKHMPPSSHIHAQDMSFDFLIHPATGCNFADHYEFSMNTGEFIPNNNFGIAKEGGWEDEQTASGD